MKQTEDIQRKQVLARELYFLLRAAGSNVRNVTYSKEEREEIYTVEMENGTKYRINVTCDSPITAAYDVLKFMQYR